MPIDPVVLTKQLIQCPSVTPNEGGAIHLLKEILTAHGFDCQIIKRGLVTNLFARWGDKQARTLGFNGHTDVVPPGDETRWTYGPFCAHEKDGVLYGRGATDMKSGVAAWVSAACLFVTNAPKNASLAIIITGDEEGPAIDGTTAILEWMGDNKETMDACIVGEPTCPDTFGEMIKIGRRGSLTAYFTAEGTQGHAAYPHRAANPIPVLARLVSILSNAMLDDGTEHFDPSTIAITTFDTGNNASNVIPGNCAATVNIRFNDAHRPETLINWLKEQAKLASADSGVSIDMTVKVSGESFITPPGKLSEIVSNAVKRETNIQPILSTSGGTSDARFIKNHCPVVEFGLVGKTMHQIDERVETAQIHKLASIYHSIITDFFNE